MAREVAVDVASHSPQVDPILDDLTEALADITAAEPEVPYYSATLFDPREEPYCDAYYWVDNLRHTVRFAAAVQAALEDGFRVFTELSPHPLLTHAVDQTARGLDMSVAALAAMRREQPLPHGLRGLVGDLYTAGAAVDFSVLYPSGQLGGCAAAGVDSPPPAAGREHRSDSRTPIPSRSTRCWARTCGCPRSRSATSGRATSAPKRCPGWPITRSTVRPPCPVPPTARWRWPRPTPCWVRPPRCATSVSSDCCCLTRRPPSVPPRRSRRPVSSPSWWRRTRVANAPDGPRRCCTAARRTTSMRTRRPHTTSRPCWRRIRSPPKAMTSAGVRHARHPVRSGLRRPGRGAHRRGSR